MKNLVKLKLTIHKQTESWFTKLTKKKNKIN